MKVRGAKQLRRRFARLVGGIEARLARQILPDAARDLASEIRAHAPPDASDFSVEAQGATRRGDRVSASVEVSDPDGGLGPVEFGTAHVAARPFIRRTFDREARGVADTIADGIAKAIDREVGR